MPALIAVLLASAAAMWAAAGAGNRLLSLAAAGAFGTAIVLAALRTNMPMWRAARRWAARSSSRPMLCAATRASPRSSMPGARRRCSPPTCSQVSPGDTAGSTEAAWRSSPARSSPTSTRWGRKARCANRALRYAAVFAVPHALAALGGLGFLLGSGKLATAKGDWAANHVFLAGGAPLWRFAC